MLEIGVQTQFAVDDEKPQAGFDMLKSAGFSCCDFSLNGYLKNTDIYDSRINRFFDRSVNELKDYFSYCRADSIIPTWCFFFVLPICIVVGFSVMVCITSPIIGYYNLKGIGYNFLVNHFGN